MRDDELLDHLLLVTDVLGQDLQGHLRGLGLTTTKAHLLWVLHGRGPSRQRDLSLALGLTPRHITTLVDELLAAGYVSRDAHPHDRRSVLVSLTVDAAALLEEMAVGRVQLGRQLFGHLDADERDELGRRLVELEETLARLTAETAGGDPDHRGTPG